MESKITCIICPLGCEVTVLYKERITTKIEGHQCKKGIEYVKEELFYPKRILTSTMIVMDGELPLVSVKTNRPVPKDRLFDVMDCISQNNVKAPINIGDVLVKDVLNLNADIVATKKVRKK
jgi:CxxC motif-containing protein